MATMLYVQTGNILDIDVLWHVGRWDSWNLQVKKNRENLDGREEKKKIQIHPNLFSVHPLKSSCLWELTGHHG